MSDTAREQPCDRKDCNGKLMQATQARQVEALDHRRRKIPALWQLSAAAR